MGSARGNDMLMPNVFPDNFAKFSVNDSIITFEYSMLFPGETRKPLTPCSIISFTPPALAATVTQLDKRLSRTTPGNGSGVCLLYTSPSPRD